MRRRLASNIRKGSTVAGLDWGRKMFETRREIREAARAKAIQKAVKKAVDKERKRILTALEQYTGLPRKEIERKILQVERS